MSNATEIKDNNQNIAIYAIRKDLIEIKNSVTELHRLVQELILKESRR